MLIFLFIGIASAQEVPETKGEGDFIGQIILFAGTFAPRNYLDCDGRLLAIQDYTSLYSLLGTNFGGDGRTTFGLPDLRGRVPIGQGYAPGLTSRYIGQFGGQESVILNSTQIPV
ncbi:MAG: tail fiber protein, partial [Candidatus Delongbacteria bacterium]|nr:tail fiber protein [Candidatus Delongbacteria bacterium]